jgi:GDPmannose 4,6-dehydratase
MKTALVTGITGQDGSYLAELLIGRDYTVHGIMRRSSSFNTARIEHLYRDPHVAARRLVLHYGDLADGAALARLMREVAPDEIYNLGAQSHVKVSFEVPEYTGDVGALGVVRLLEAIRQAGMERRTRFYQASSSEQYGKVVESPQSETTPFYPRSPYAAAKAYAFYLTRTYREAYGLYAVNGILFNHESPRRGATFVTRKITRAVAMIHERLQDCLYLGNLDARRDWGFAGDYVRAMWLMLQQAAPDDYVVATGEMHSVREFAGLAFRRVGVELTWQGHGPDEIGRGSDGRVYVRIDPAYYRPAEVDELLGDSRKARRVLGWEPTVGFEQLVAMMVDADLQEARTLIHGSGRPPGASAGSGGA